MRSVVLICALICGCAIPAHAQIAFVAKANCGQGTGGTSCTTGAINTTTANFLVASVSGDDTATTAAITDSQSNSWTCLTLSTVAGSIETKICYVLSPTTNAAHTFTSGTAGSFSNIEVAAFSGVLAAAAFDQQNGATTASAATLSTGSVTPSENNELLIAGIGYAGTITPVIDSSFTITDLVSFTPGDHYGGGLAYKIQTSLGAENPAWSWTGNVAAAARIATFKAAAIVGPPVGSLLLLGVGR